MFSKVSTIVLTLLSRLTFDADLAHLTSLEEMLRIMMAEGKVSDRVIETLWKIYGTYTLCMP